MLGPTLGTIRITLVVLALTLGVLSNPPASAQAVAELSFDSKLVETFGLPTAVNDRRFVPVWRYQLDTGQHEARLVITNPTEGAYLWLDYVIIYAGAPR